MRDCPGVDSSSSVCCFVGPLYFYPRLVNPTVNGTERKESTREKKSKIATILLSAAEKSLPIAAAIPIDDRKRCDVYFAGK